MLNKLFKKIVGGHPKAMLAALAVVGVLGFGQTTFAATAYTITS